jgi:hypothetical protein
MATNTSGLKEGEPLKVTHNFMLKDGTVVDSLPPEEEEKIKQRMRETFWQTFYVAVRKQEKEQKSAS